MEPWSSVVIEKGISGLRRSQRNLLGLIGQVFLVAMFYFVVLAILLALFS